jgi:hypothetical protein
MHNVRQSSLLYVALIDQISYANAWFQISINRRARFTTTYRQVAN